MVSTSSFTRAAILLLGCILAMTKAQVWIEDPFQAKLGSEEEHGLFAEEEEFGHGMFAAEEIGHGVALLDTEEIGHGVALLEAEEIGHGYMMPGMNNKEVQVWDKRSAEEEPEVKIETLSLTSLDHIEKRETGHAGHAGHGVFMGHAEEEVGGHEGHIDQLVDELEKEMVGSAEHEHEQHHGEIDTNSHEDFKRRAPGRFKRRNPGRY